MRQNTNETETSRNYSSALGQTLIAFSDGAAARPMNTLAAS
ncbi:hypothetical protein ABH924_000569 [Arthrobacter sp. GAS37]